MMKRRLTALFMTLCLLISMVPMNMPAAADTADICTGEGHNWTDAWTRDAEHHWHECTNAGCPITDHSQKNGYAECTYIYTLAPGSMIMHMKLCTICQRTSGYERCKFTVSKYDDLAHWKTCELCGAASDSTWGMHADSNSDGSCDGCGYTMHTHTYAPATCAAPAVCACGAATGDPDKTNHTGGTEIRGAVSADGKNNGYTGDTWCLGCNTILASGQVIHIHNWQESWSSDWTNGHYLHWHECANAGCPITDHSQKSGYAECSRVTVLVPGSTIMHMQLCSVCQKSGGHERCKFTVSKYDDLAHWKTCELCGAASDSTWGMHADSNSDGSCDGCGYTMHTHTYTPATCAAPAVCACGAATGDPDKTNHTGGTEIRGAVSADGKNNGYTGDTWCLGCNTILASGQVITGHIHSYTDATCAKPATCSCGDTVGKTDPSNHTATCTCNIKRYERCSLCQYSLNAPFNYELSFRLNTGNSIAFDSMDAPIGNGQIESLFAGTAVTPITVDGTSDNAMYGVGCDHCMLLGWIAGGETDTFIDHAVIEAGKSYAVYGLMHKHFSSVSDQEDNKSALMTISFDESNEFLSIHSSAQIIGVYDLNPYAGALGSESADQEQAYSQWMAANGPAFEFRPVQIGSEKLTAVINPKNEAPFMIFAIVAAERIHTVKAGDTLTHIAQKYGCSIEEIVSLNGRLIKDISHIQVGWKLCIPAE